MAAPLKDIIVNVLDDSGNALANAAVTLLGGATPQVLQTDAAGRCTFPAVAPGNYRLIVVSDGLNSRAQNVTHTATANSTVTVNMKVVDEESHASKRSLIFQLLTVFQYLLFGALAVGFAWVLSKGFPKELDLSNKDAARGMITYVVSVVTVAIGLLLVVSAAFLSGSKDLEKRFAFGKDVFTVLVGVLGTVMGFYYGQTAAAGGPTNTPGQTGQTIQISAPQLTPPPRVGAEFTMTANITGGEKPYTYTVTFSNPAAITGNPSVPPQTDGTISQKFGIAGTAPPNQAITYKIDVTDKNGLKGTIDKQTFTPTPAQ